MSFYRSSEHTSMKVRRCENCRQPINIGDRYSRSVGVWDGDFYDVSSHIECRDDRLMHMHNSNIDEAGTLLDEIDSSGEPLDAFELQPITELRIRKTLAEREARIEAALQQHAEIIAESEGLP